MPREKRKLVALTIASIILALAGLLIDASGFLVNVFSGFSGALLGIWISIDIVEVILNKHLEGEWKQALETVIRNIIIYANDIAVGYIDLLPVAGEFVKLVDNTEAVDEDRVNLVKRLIEQISSSGTLSDVKHVEVKVLYSRVRPAISRLHDLQLAYMTIPGGTSELVKHLQKLEREVFTWDQAMLKDEQMGIQARTMFENAIACLKAACEILDHLT